MSSVKRKKTSIVPKNQMNHENGQWAQKRKKHPSEMKVAPPHKLFALHALLSADTSFTTFIAYTLTNMPS